MNLKNNTAALVLIALVVSGIGGYLIGERSSRPAESMHEMPDGTMMANTAPTMHGSMAGMMAGLEGKKGDELDKAFLEEMIVHHEGAVDMAQAILKDGKHPELKTLAQNIVTAQTGEIAQMKSWLAAWYPNQ